CLGVARDIPRFEDGVDFFHLLGSDQVAQPDRDRIARRHDDLEAGIEHLEDVDRGLTASDIALLERRHLGYPVSWIDGLVANGKLLLQVKCSDIKTSPREPVCQTTRRVNSRRSLVNPRQT